VACTPPKTPGVYISEPGSFPPSIVGVDTAVPAFIGYTDRANDKGKDLNCVPMKISSVADYAAMFGGNLTRRYSLLGAAGVPEEGARIIGTIQLDEGECKLVGGPHDRFNLYNSLRLFYANGGGDCYIVSCGSYGGESGATSVEKAALLEGLAAVTNVVGPTMLVAPDAVLLPEGADHAEVVVAMLNQCLEKRDRVAILDVWGAEALRPGDDIGSIVAGFRDGLAGAPPESLQFGMAYFPFLQTSIVPSGEISAGDFAPAAGMQAVVAGTPGFAALAQLAARDQSLLPPSGAMAGIYTANDSLIGVWNAPANVGIAQAIGPTLQITADQQEDLNAPSGGMSINAIRTFVNRGTLVWGARTLDGNSNDWRYVQVRRTMIYVEQSVKTALNNFAFAPNTAQTWVTVTSTIESFLHGLWAAGGLMGSSPEQAYGVQCGLGSTMTPDDVLDGKMIVQVVLQMVHPAEFMELTFLQEMLGGA
jgi:phage tail sheath protein FI